MEYDKTNILASAGDWVIGIFVAGISAAVLATNVRFSIFPFLDGET
jgi:hypothetical protein